MTTHSAAPSNRCCYCQLRGISAWLCAVGTKNQSRSCATSIIDFRMRVSRNSKHKHITLCVRHGRCCFRTHMLPHVHTGAYHKHIQLTRRTRMLNSIYAKLQRNPIMRVCVCNICVSLHTHAHLLDVGDAQTNSYADNFAIRVSANFAIREDERAHMHSPCARNDWFMRRKYTR